MKKFLFLCATLFATTVFAQTTSGASDPRIFQMDLTWSGDTSINANFAVAGNFPLTVTFTVNRQSGAQEKLLDTSFSYTSEGYKQAYLRGIGTQDKDFHLVVSVSDTTGNYNLYGYDILGSPFFASPTGIALIEEKTIAVFPNPFKNALNVTVQEEDWSLHIADLTGRKVLSSPIIGSSVSTENVPAGIYIASILDSKGSIRETKRISKE